MRSLLAILALALVACQPFNLQENYPCRVDGDCDSDFTCEQQQCRLGRICNDDSRCGPGYSCVGHVCHHTSDNAPDGGSDAGTCEPTTCAKLGATCGTPDDGCGHPLSCGSACGTGQVCNPVSFACCTPKSASEACAGATCGGKDDGCGGTLDCGACAAGTTCGGGGQPGQCGCTPQTVCEPGWCGARPNGCGGTLDCGNPCAANESCGGGGVPNVCGATQPLRNGWHWQVPTSGGNALAALWMSGTGTAQEGWATGGAGELRHYASGVWTRMPGVIPDVGRAVWGSSAGDVWVAGGNRMLYRWTGSFQSVQQGANDTYALHGTGPNDVWAVGAQGQIQHFTGAWSNVASGTAQDLNAVHAFSATEVWAVGNGGAVVRLSGSAFGPVASGVTQPLRAVWGTSASDVWVGGDGVLSHWNGSSWAAATGIPVGTSWTALTGTSPTDVWATGNAVQQMSVIAHFDGAAWTVHSRFIANGRTLLAAWATSPADAWFSGRDGALLRWDGRSFRGNVLGVPDGALGPAAIFGSATNDVWLASGDGSDQGRAIFLWDGRDYLAVPFPLVPTGIVQGVSFSRNQAFAAVNTTGANAGPEARVALWDGQRWTAPTALSAPGATITSAWASSPTSLLLATITSGKPGLMRVIDGAPSSVPSGLQNPIASLWGARASDVYGVAGGAVVHSTGGPFAPVDTKISGASYSAVGGLSSSEVWAAGNVVARFDGAGWQQVPHPFGTARFTRIWVAAPGHVFVSGPQGWAEYAGGAWKTQVLNWEQGMLFWGASVDDYFSASTSAPWAAFSHPNNTGADYAVPRGLIEGQPHFTWAGQLMNGNPIAANGAYGAALFGTWAPWYGTGTNDSTTTLWGTNWNDFYLGTASGAVFHEPGGNFKVELPATGAPIEAIWGPALAHSNDDGQTPATDVWAVSAGGCWHRLSGNWAQVAGCSGVAVHGASASDVWIAAANRTLHWNGTALSADIAVPAGVTVRGIYGASGGIAWLCGFDGAGKGIVAKWDGVQWATAFTYGRPLRRIAGLGSKVVAVGSGGMVTFDGQTWTTSEDSDADFVGLSMVPGAAGGPAIGAAIGATGVILQPDAP